MLNGIRPNINRLLITATSAVAFALGSRFGYGLDILPSTAIAAGAAVTGYAGARFYSLFNDVESLIQRLNNRTMNGIEETIDANRQFMVAVQNQVDNLEPLIRSVNRFAGRLSINANLLQHDLTQQLRRIIRQNRNVGQDINNVLTAARDYLTNAMDENPELAEGIMQATTTLNRILDTIQTVMAAHGIQIPAANRPEQADQEPQIDVPVEIQEMLARLAEIGQRAEAAMNGNENNHQEAEEHEEVVARPILIAARNRRQPVEADEPRRSERLAEQRRRLA